MSHERSDVITSAIPAGAAAGLDPLVSALARVERLEAELAALRLLHSTPAGLVLTGEFDGRAQVLLEESCVGFDAVIAMPGAKVIRTDHGVPEVVEAHIGRLRLTAQWPRFCTRGDDGTHAYVAARPETYAREVHPSRGYCRRCNEYLAPAFDPGEVAS